MIGRLGLVDRVTRFSTGSQASLLLRNKQLAEHSRARDVDACGAFFFVRGIVSFKGLFWFFWVFFCCFFLVFRGPGAVKQEKASRNTETNSKINFIFGAGQNAKVILILIVCVTFFCLLPFFVFFLFFGLPIMCFGSLPSVSEAARAWRDGRRVTGAAWRVQVVPGRP